MARSRWWAVSAVVAGLLVAGCSTAPKPGEWVRDPKLTLPNSPRELRGVWVASVGNIDWPRKRGLSASENRADMNAILDRCQQLHLNTVIFHCRPSCDALYKSDLEPWSVYLTGQNGKPPEDPNYDPLQEWIDGAHKRGMELHAWINPFRAKAGGADASDLAPGSVAKTHPEWVKKYGSFLWLDPGIPEARDHSLAVIEDIVKRYDVDGIHVDDYFYPYPETVSDKDKTVIPFPDDETYAKYGKGQTLGDFRRASIDDFMQKMYYRTKKEKRWVKVGISPFGIWRPHNPPQIEGFDSYDKIYCDSKKWINLGWGDYFTPQLYWPIAQEKQSFPVLLDWWVSQNTKARQLAPGLFTGRITPPEDPNSKSKPWQPTEILNQIEMTRLRYPNAVGDVHFPMNVFMKDSQGINEKLVEGPYGQCALAPESPWLGSNSPGSPKVTVTSSDADGSVTATWKPAGDPPRVWMVAVQYNQKNWTYHTFGPDETTATFQRDSVLGNPTAVAVSAADRLGNESKRVVYHP